MKIYSAAAPNPRRVRIFLAEKNLDIETVDIDLMRGETQTDHFRSLNSLGKTPVLALEDGRVICESVSICRYLEEVTPEPPLLGRDSFERAYVDMWNRRIELEYFQLVANIAQHTFPFFADHVEQNPTFAESQKRAAADKQVWLNGELKDKREFFSGDQFTIADITGMVAFDLGIHAGVPVSDELEHLSAWWKRVQSRPSMAA